MASSTNRLTLIAAIVPMDVVTTHTLFCVKEALDEDSQRYLCAVLNSFVANYFIRMRVSTHVSAGIIARLRAPLPRRHSRQFREIVDLSAALEKAGLPAGSEGGFEDGARAAGAGGNGLRRDTTSAKAHPDRRYLYCHNEIGTQRSRAFTI